jgi:integrase
MTFGELIEEYITVHVSKLKSAGLISSCLRRYSVPLLVCDVKMLEKRDFAKVHAEIGKTAPAAANAALKNWAACLEYAVEENYIPFNPCKRITRFKEKPRKRFLSNDEIARLNDSLRREPVMHRAYVRMVMLTACRRDEARLAQWQHLDLGNGRWIQPDTKNGTTHMTALSPDLVEDLRTLHKATRPHPTDYVFRTKTGKAWDDAWVHHIWSNIRVRAGIEDVHIHDLRRTTATLLDQKGVSVSTIQKVLNHKNLVTTQRYLVGLSVNDDVVDALDDVARVIGQ